MVKKYIDGKKDNGFTIIEVTLVLAISGLIFAIVFIVLPSVQMARRNHSRKVYANSFLSALENYAINNNGKVPGQGLDHNSFARQEASDKFFNEYMDPYKDPLSGEYYDSDPVDGTVSWGPSIGGLGYIDWMSGTGCSGSVFAEKREISEILADGGDESYMAVVIGLEPGDYDHDKYWDASVPGWNEDPQVYYCVDNS